MLYRFITIAFILLLPATHSRAQVDVGLGAELGFPLMFNKYVGSYNHSLGSPGLRATFSYLPPQSTFLPALILNIASVQLPVYRISGDNVLYMNFANYSALLTGRIRKTMEKKEILFGGGIGVAYFRGTGVGINGKDIQVSRVLDDSSNLITMVMPQICINAEYMFPISSEVPLYAGIGGQLQYIYFYDKQTYRVDILDQNSIPYSFKPQLYGHMINPSVYISLYYRFGKRDAYGY